MLYSKEIIIPANTPSIDPTVTRLEVCQGVVQQVWVRWRWGSANLCGAQIRRNDRSVWPYTMGEWFPSMALDTTWEDSYPLDDVPYFFDIAAYNEDDTFAHSLWVALNVVRPDVPMGVLEFLRYLIKGGKSG